MRNEEEKTLKQQTEDYLQLISDAIYDLEKLSVENDDIFSYEIENMKDLVKSVRRQL